MKVSPRNALQIDSNHLRSFYNMQREIEDGVSKKIESIRKRAEDIDAEQVERDMKPRRIGGKDRNGKKRKYIGKKMHQTRNISRPVLETTDGTLPSSSNKKWKNSKGVMSTNGHLGEVNQNSFDSTNSDQSLKERQRLDKETEEEKERIPYRLPKLQIPHHLSQTNNLRQLPDNPGPRIEEGEASSAEAFSLISLGEESNSPTTQENQEQQTRLQHIKDESDIVTTQQRTMDEKTRPRRKKLKREGTNPLVVGSLDRSRGGVFELETNDTADRPHTPEMERTKDDIDKEELASVEQSMSVDDDNFSDTQEEYLELDLQTTIKSKPIPKVKWDPNSRSDIMRRKLNNLMRKRRMARLDRIRLGELHEEETRLKNYSDYTSNSREPLDMEVYQSAPEFSKHGKIVHPKKRKKRGKLKGRASVTQKSTSNAFSFSYFS